MSDPFVCPSCQKEKKHYGLGVCRDCYMRQYRERPGARERHAEIERNRRAAGKTKESERKRSSSEKRQAWKRTYNLEYFSNHREKLLEYQRQYRKQTARQTTYKQRRRNRVRGLPATLTPGEWQELLEQYDHRCAYCGASGVYLEREHRTPASRGGGFDKENIVPACGMCNRRKGAKTEEEFLAYLRSLD